ncbi:MULTISPECIES: MerR family transcriptional regulator [Microbacterium]|uniref:MerR family transcriptional regulator n=1 Tax=Microbacterium TaxID=33882 RepID=UPI003558E937
MTHRDSRTPLYGIAVAAQLVDLPEATLRLFESKGLLLPARSEGGTRRYSDDDIDRLRRAAQLRDDGLNIVGIARVLELQDENADLRESLADDSASASDRERPTSRRS